jgi:hypothetical protein
VLNSDKMKTEGFQPKRYWWDVAAAADSNEVGLRAPTGAASRQGRQWR